MKLIIIMEGGLIQNVIADEEDPPEVWVCDYDTEGTSDDDAVRLIPQASYSYDDSGDLRESEPEPAIVSPFAADVEPAEVYTILNAPAPESEAARVKRLAGAAALAFSRGWSA